MPDVPLTFCRKEKNMNDYTELFQVAKELQEEIQETINEKFRNAGFTPREIKIIIGLFLQNIVNPKG